jgi:prepilin-type N-terminal cleavage/methylation domain-containing protein
MIRHRAPIARRDDRGVSLVEMLIVIAVMGILAAAAVLTVRSFSDSSNENACLAEVAEVNTAIRAYYSEHKVWVTTQTMDLLVPDLLDEVPSADTPSGGGTIGTDHQFEATQC